MAANDQMRNVWCFICEVMSLLFGLKQLRNCRFITPNNKPNSFAVGNFSKQSQPKHGKKLVINLFHHLLLINVIRLE